MTVLPDETEVYRVFLWRIRWQGTDYGYWASFA